MVDSQGVDIVVLDTLGVVADYCKQEQGANIDFDWNAFELW